MGRRYTAWWVGPAALLWLAGAGPAPETVTLAVQSSQGGTQAEEEEDYFEKWLKEDVVYIITDEERAVFESLTTFEEKEQFIEQFWFRRDPDPTTPINEFKEEHYRRIAYANEHFTSGDPGWRTDRGRIYIIHGPPDNIETRPMGGTYVRRIQEGGGVTAVYPYEKWTYRHIEGVGDNVELEFVDPTGTGEYKLAVNPWEKDALLQFPGAGRTLAEQTGLSTRAYRPELIPAAGGAGYNPQEWYRSATDTPFARYEKVAKVGGAPITRYPDLKELVKVDIHYEILSCRLEANFFRLNEAQDLVAATVVVPNRDLTFQAEGEFQVARLGIYAVVSNMSNRIVQEFEDDLVVRYRPEELEAGRRKQSVYQKVFPIEHRGRHKIDLVVKDLVSGKIGVIRQALNAPPYDAEKLTLSTLLLSDRVEPLGRIPEQDEMFVIGDVKVLPRPEHEFAPGMPLGIYLQVYNARFDQATGNPFLVVTYRLFRDGRELRRAREVNGESIYYLSTRRIVLLRNLSLEGLEPGRYEIRVEIEDQLSGQQATAEGSFTLTPAQMMASS